MSKGKPFWETFWWQVSDEVNATLREQIARAAQGEFVRWDTPIYGRAGGKETIIIDGSLMPVKDEHGEVVFIAAEGRDITEKKAYEREIARQREELAQLDELKTQFFANISHEFRTPLTLMMGPLEDALAGPGGPVARKPRAAGARAPQRAAAAQAGQHPARVLADRGRPHRGLVRADRPLDPDGRARQRLSLCHRARRAHARRRLSAARRSPSTSTATMWEKLVLNLLSNAFKFTFEGEIEVSLRMVGQAVRLTVRDTGTGIPADELPRLFERFHRVKNARGRSFEGSGIGLAFVRELVRLHGGEVSVESTFGSGSAFFVTVPLGSAHLPADRIDAPRHQTPTGTGPEAFVQEALRWLPDETADVDRRPRRALRADPQSDDDLAGSHILVADDNSDMREYIRRLLAGYDVVAVADGGAALRSARARRPDLVLTDVMMPGVDGLELMREFRADPTLSYVPVILLSARAGEESRIEGLEAGRTSTS